MNTWVVFVLTAFVVITVATGVFFFATTRGTLMWRVFAPGGRDEKSHVYPLYSDMRLIKLVDQQPIISAILLFQYHCLVSKVIAEIGTIDLHGRKLLITSCAFGNVIPRVVKAAVEQGVERVLIADIIDNELIHARSKLGEFAQKVELVSADAAAMQQADGVVAANVIFFLLHELPHHLKGKALSEAARLVAPGGKLILAEFHRPQPAVLEPLLDRLAAFNPSMIVIEHLSGESVSGLLEYDTIYPGTADLFGSRLMLGAALGREGTKLDMPEAEAEARRIGPVTGKLQ